MRCRQAILRAGLSLLLTLGAVQAALAADYPPPQAGDYVIRDFRLHSGETRPELRVDYLTFGNLHHAPRPARRRGPSGHPTRQTN